MLHLLIHCGDQEESFGRVFSAGSLPQKPTGLSPKFEHLHVTLETKSLSLKVAQNSFQHLNLDGSL